MKCPNDKTEMDEGVLAMEGMQWMLKQKVSKFASMFVPNLGNKVSAWKCPTCGEIKLVASK